MSYEDVPRDASLAPPLPPEPLGHAHDRGLVVQEVAARDRVFKVEIRRVAFAAQVDRSVDAALGADTVAAFDGDKAEELNFVTGFGQLHGGHEAGESASDDNDFVLGRH